MTTQQIGYFLKLAEELNYTTVARMFFITQPTLSKQISNLEHELKIVLFQRDHNNVVLTPAGKKFYEKMKPLFLEMMDAIREAQTYEDERDNLVIAIQEEQLVSASFMLAINRLRHMYPDIKVAIHRVGNNELFEGLDSGRFDIANMLYMPTYHFADKYNYTELNQEASYLAYAKNKLTLPSEITKSQLADILKQYELILPYVIDGVDDELAKKMFLEHMVGVAEDDDVKIQITQSGRPISLPLQVSSGQGVSVSNKTNLFTLDPVVELSEIIGTANSYSKGLLTTKQPSSPYIKALIKMALEEQEKMNE